MKDTTNKTLKGLGFCTTVGAIAVAGYLAYNVVYQNVNYAIASENARNTYNERNVDFDDVSLDEDLSKYVFNKTGVDVSKDEYFKEVNLKINEATTLEELKEVAISYIQGYFEYNNIRLDKTSVDLALDGEQGVVTYDDRVMRFDPDAEVVFGDLIETIGDIKYETSDLTDEELKKVLVKQILLSELYEVVTINEQQLTLRPVKCPNDEFTI